MSERLVEFLYILARDELPMGTIEGIMWDHVTGGEPDSYCNTYLEEWARDLATRLSDETSPITSWKHMYKDSEMRFRVQEDGVKLPDPGGGVG